MRFIGPILSRAPTFTTQQAAAIAQQQFDLVSIAEELPSERDQNFVLTTETGDKFILKIANATEQRSLLEAQNDAMTHLASRVSFCPRVVPSRSGQAIAQIRTATAQHYVRLVTYLRGVPLAEAEQTPRLLFNLGRRLGELSRAMSDFDHLEFHRDFHWDLANAQRVIDEYEPLITEKELRDQIGKCRSTFDSGVELPFKVIHGDANDYNVLVHHDDVVGLIDFGDMIYSFRAGELAIALAYVVLDKSDPLMNAKAVVAGYRSGFELNREEIESLWPLMLMRLCMSICLAAYQRQQKPDNPYLDVSQSAIRRSFPGLAAIDSGLASKEFQAIAL
jgi:Putative homoserine kinase type II (protein kinase fold)